jgi:hypothetical protein
MIKLRSTVAAAALSAGVLAVGMAGAAHAGTITWDMSNGVGNPGMAVGTTQNITACGGCGITISAAGFTNSGLGTPTNLFLKNLGGNEVGMGLTDDPSGENEITGANVVVVNFSNAITFGNLVSASFDIKFGSTTDNESWIVFGSQTGAAGSFLTQVAAGNDQGVHSGLALFNFYMVESTSPPPFGGGSNVLLSEVSGVSMVPEPQTWAMMLLGFVGLGFAFRHKRKITALA